MSDIYIALGTNIEPRKKHLLRALKLLDQTPQITLTEQSSIYETAPVGFTDQAYFLNMVVRIETELQPVALLDACQAVEEVLGRVRTIRFGPRTIDVDIILYNDLLIESERLTVPHPRMHERAFVLVPLAELAPNTQVPAVEKTVARLLAECPDSDKKDVVQWNGKDLEDG